ncbi:MAG: TetR/AcrR family transcriptional regulator [Chthoniobacterales bacterium]
MAKGPEYIDPRIRRTRKLLQQAFFELVKERAFDAITVQDIAERATLNRATFYMHFVDKFALLNYTIGELFLENLNARLGENPPCKLRALILTTCEFLKKANEYSTGCNQFAPLLESKVKNLIRETLYVELKSRNPKKSRTDADLGLAATVASWAIFGAALEWSRSERAANAEAFTEQVIPLILASLEISSGGTCGKGSKPVSPSRNTAASTRT